MMSSEQLLKLRESPNLPKLNERLRDELRQRRERQDPVEWAERHYRLEDTGEPIVLEPHQKAVLRYALQRDGDRFRFQTIVYSTIKKSGKTAIAGLVAQWAADTWGRFGEIYCVGNDAEQAKERAFKAVKTSIEVDPQYDPARQETREHWRTMTKEIVNLKTGTTIKAIATDYRGEAGSNPILVLWTELWGFIQKADLRFWAEMAPSPTRPNSVQWVETYAGYEGESELLWNLYTNAVTNGRQLTAGELGDLSAFAEAPNPDSLVPCYVNERAGIFAYWDEGLVARRMPWQKGEAGQRYYDNEAGRQTQAQMDRLHGNHWVSAESNFIPIEWWDRSIKPMPLTPGDSTPMVVALDAAVSGDCFGLLAVTRDPDKPDPPGVAVRAVHMWAPPPGGKIDYAGPEAVVRQLCRDFNVVEVAYDQYQLHDMATRLQNEGVAWFRSFSQGEERLKADKQLYDLIVHDRVRHDGNLDLREHLTNANAKHSSGEDTRLRLVKKSEHRHIDLAVCLSMAAAECLRLYLE